MFHQEQQSWIDCRATHKFSPLRRTLTGRAILLSFFSSASEIGVILGTKSGIPCACHVIKIVKFTLKAVSLELQHVNDGTENSINDIIRTSIPSGHGTSK